MRKYLTYPVTLFLWVLLAHIIIVKNTYNIDDHFVIDKNEQVQQGIAAIPDILTSFYIQKEKITFYYRPIPKILYALEYECFSDNPHLFHFVQLVLFGLLIIIIWQFFIALLGERHKRPIWAGLMLFVVFPTNTEVIASLKNVDIILAALFAFLSLKYFLKFHDNQKWILLPVALFLLFLSVISKQDGLLFFLAGSIGIIFFRRKKVKHIILAFFLMAIALFSYKVIIHLLGSHGRVDEFLENPLFNIENRFLRFTTGLGIIWFYVKMLIIPYPLSFYYGYKMLDIYRINDWQVWAGLIVIVCLLVFALINIRKNKLYTFVLLALAGGLIFYSNILFKPLAGIVGDRYLFLSSLFFLFLLTFFFFENIFSRGNILLVKIGFIFFLGIYTIITVQRDLQWRNTETLYSHDIKHLWNSAKANELYATMIIVNINESLHSGKNPQLLQDSILLAEKHFNRILELGVKSYSANANLALINMLYKKNIKNALYHFEEATKLATDFIGKEEEKKLYYYYGYCLMQSKEYEKAKSYFEHVCKLDSFNLMAYNLWSSAEYHTKSFDKAIAINRSLIKKDFGGIQPYLNLAMCYMEKGDKNAGVKYFKKVLGMQPGNKIACWHLAEYYHAIGNTDSAKYYNGKMKERYDY